MHLSQRVIQIGMLAGLLATSLMAQESPARVSGKDDVSIREGMKAQFRAEAYNVFNTAIFSANPDLTPMSANSGKIFRDNGQSNSPRIVQLGFPFEY